MNPTLLRYAGVALVAAVVGFGGATLVKNNDNKAQVDRGPDITISDVYINPVNGSFSLYWTTNVRTNGKVEYGPTDAYGQEVQIMETAGAWGSKYHGIGHSNWHVPLPDSFHFRIVATDPETGKEVKSRDYAVDLSQTTGECKNTVHVPEDYSSIQAAIYAACPNGTVMVSPGTYHEEIWIGDGINLIGTSPSNTKIISPAAAGPTITMRMHRYGNKVIKNPSTVSGFTISSDWLESQPPPPIFERGPAIAALDNPYKSSGVGSIGLVFDEGAIVKNNIFSHNNIGITTSYDGPSGTIENNTFVGGKGSNYGMLVWLVNSLGRISLLVIQNNAVVNHKAAGIRIACEIYLIDSCKEQWVEKAFLRYNNFWHNGDDYSFESAYHVGEGNYSQARPQEYRMPFFNPMWQYSAWLKGKEADQTGKNGNISADPLFANSNAGDFHERAGSPHVDAGNPQSDFSLEPQPNGGRINIGTYGNTAEATRSR